MVSTLVLPALLLPFIVRDALVARTLMVEGPFVSRVVGVLVPVTVTVFVPFPPFTVREASSEPV